MSDTPLTDAEIVRIHGKIESARACDLEDLARDMECRFNALCAALKTHAGDTDGYEFGLGRVKFENGAPVSFLWAGQDEIDAAIDTVMRELVAK